MFLNGNRDGVVVSVQHISIHGTIMVDVTIQRKTETVPRSARLGPEAITGQLSVGAPIIVTFLMNVVTGIKTAEQTKNPGHRWCPGNRG